MQLLATYLKQSGLRQIDLARRSSTSPAVICDVLKGRRKHFSPEVARRITDTFSALLGEEETYGLYEKLGGLPPPKPIRRVRTGARKSSATS
jgi:hypothetical protein